MGGLLSRALVYIILIDIIEKFNIKKIIFILKLDSYLFKIIKNFETSIKISVFENNPFISGI